MPLIPIVGFAPDADPTLPGVLLECSGWIPSPRGMHTSYSASSPGFDALAAACKGLYISRLTDGTTILFAGTATQLYKLDTSDGSWDVVSLGGGPYTTVTAWRFATQGLVTLAASATNKLQYATSGSFALVTSGGTDAPKASVICTTLGFVMVGNYDDGTAVTDGWYCSALNDYDDWITSVATQSAKGRLLDTPGPITAMRTLNETVIAFKNRSCYQGVYQGPPVIWSWRLISSDVGSVSQEATVDLTYALAWVGYDGIWWMDASGVPQRIDQGIREWFFTAVDRAYMDKIQGLYDRERQVIYWFYATKTAGAGALTDWIAWNVQTKRWGAGQLTIEWAAETLTATETYDSYFPSFSTWDSLPSATYDSTTLVGSVPYPTIVTTAHLVSYLGGVAGTSTLRTARFGSEQGITQVRRVAPRWTKVPTSASLINGYVATTGSSMTDDASTAMDSKNRFDFTRSARWHDLELTTVGDAEITGIDVDSTVAGTE